MKFLPVQWFDSLPSTNTHLRERLAGAAGESGGSDAGAAARGESAGVPSGTVVAAREQTAGRGRFDRRWVSEPGRDLAFSFVVRTRAAVSRLPSLPMAAALGVAETLEALGLAPQLKWPNDVLVGGRKICGILAEAVSLSGRSGGPAPNDWDSARGEAATPGNSGLVSDGKPARNDGPAAAGRQDQHAATPPSPASERAAGTEGHSGKESIANGIQRPAAAERAVVVGVGVNVNMDAGTAARIPKPATSVRIETGSTLPIETLLSEILMHLERWIGEWEVGGFASLRAAWESRAARPGATMAVEAHGRRIEGALAGYGDQGELLLRDASGKLHAIGSGDATVLRNINPTDTGAN